MHRRDFLIGIGSIAVYPYFGCVNNDKVRAKSITYRLNSFNCESTGFSVSMIDINYDKGKQKIVFSGNHRLVTDALINFQDRLENTIKYHDDFSLLSYEVEFDPPLVKFDCSKYELYRKDVNEIFDYIQEKHKKVNIEKWVDHKW